MKPGNNKGIPPPDLAAAFEQERVAGKQWYRKHKHEIPAAIPYDSYSEAVQRAIKRALQSAKNIATGDGSEDGSEAEVRTETDDGEQPPDNGEEKRSAIERSVEGTRFDRTGEKFKELGDGGDSLDESLTRAIEGLAGGRYAEAIEAFFRRKDGETCREIAQSFYVRDGKTGLPVHPWPGTVRKWIEWVETWLDRLAGEDGLVGELKARFLRELDNGLRQLKKDAQWSRLQSELRSDRNGNGTTANRAKLVPRSGAWWETHDQPDLKRVKPRPEPSPDDELEEDDEDSPTWQQAKTLAGGRFWNNRPIPNGRCVLFFAGELTPDDLEYGQLLEQVNRLRSRSPEVEAPKTSTICAVEPSRSQIEARKKDLAKIAEAQALREARPKKLLTPKQGRAKVAEDGFLAGLESWTEFERGEFCEIVDLLRAGRHVDDIAKILKMPKRTVEARIASLKKLARSSATNKESTT